MQRHAPGAQCCQFDNTKQVHFMLASWFMQRGLYKRMQAPAHSFPGRFAG